MLNMRIYDKMTQTMSLCLCFVCVREVNLILYFQKKYKNKKVNRETRLKKIKLRK